VLDLVITGGQICRPREELQLADIGVRDGVIVDLYAPGSAPEARETIDATGKVVMPGMLDAHVHPGVYLPLDEDLQYVTRFAAIGGITTIVPFYRPTDAYLDALPGALDVYRANSYLDFQFILGITRHEHIDQLAAVGEMYGLRAFKFYLGYCGHEERFSADFPFTDDNLVRVFEALSELPGDPLLAVHCENSKISEYYQEKLRGGDQNLDFYNRIHPVISEVDSAVHISLLGSHYGVRTCIVHVSAGTTASVLKSLPWRDKQNSVLETCPHYLFFDVDDPPGLRGVVRPRVRRREEADALWEFVADGTLDTLGSDNCANRLEDKDSLDVYSTPRLGMGELGLTLPLMLSEGHHARGLPLQRIVEMGSENIAKAHGIFPRKGALLPGSDADLVVVDLDKVQTVDADALKGREEGSIYQGRELRGWPVVTVVGGRVLVRDGHVDAAPGGARFLGAGTETGAR
jgi:dihydropyrimidinase